jgi:hypothetical protein
LNKGTEMNMTRNSLSPSAKGPVEHFTGVVRSDSSQIAGKTADWMEKVSNEQDQVR